MPECRQCPRNCGADREKTIGYCGAPAGFRVARVSLHEWEEPCVSGKHGSGTVFFSGCNLRCAFCQNYELSHAAKGENLSDDALEREMLRLRDLGAENINLVTPTHYAEKLADFLPRVRKKLGIPIVYNCGGYESVDALRRLEGLVDIYLPDFKYVDSELSARYSGAPDYCEVATAALAEMLRQTGKPTFNEQGNLLRGTIVRHLVLPGARKDSIRVLNLLAERFGSDAFLLSLMNQYTPAFAENCPYPELHRRVTTFEYESVLAEAQRLGFEGYSQERSAATTAYTPDFNREKPQG